MTNFYRLFNKFLEEQCVVVPWKKPLNMHWKKMWIALHWKVTKRVDGQVAEDPHRQQAPDARAMGALLEKATLEKYKAGELVIEKGTAGSIVYILRSGAVLCTDIQL